MTGDAVDATAVLSRTGDAGGERHDPWVPWTVTDASPDEVIHPRDLQAAIDRAVVTGVRRHIRLTRGEGEGPVIVPRAAPPLTITAPDGARLSAAIDAQMPGAEYRRRFAGRFDGSPPPVRAVVDAICARDIITTHNSGVVRIEADDTTLRGLTVENTYACDRAAAAPEGAVPDARGRFAQGQHQAVALHVAGADRVHLEGLVLLSFQDTLYLQHPRPFSTARTYLTGCEIAGDVDFIFGQATAVFDRCRITSRGERGASTWVAAPATNIATPFGFVFDRCTFDDDGHIAAGGALLGRQWFEGVRTSPYRGDLDCRMADVSGQGTISCATLEPVGKCRVQNSVLGAHLAGDPWGPWTGPDSARHRPVQRNRAEMAGLLGAWLAREGVTLPESAGPWLGVADCIRD